MAMLRRAIPRHRRGLYSEIKRDRTPRRGSEARGIDRNAWIDRGFAAEIRDWIGGGGEEEGSRRAVGQTKRGIEEASTPMEERE